MFNVKCKCGHTLSEYHPPGTAPAGYAWVLQPLLNVSREPVSTNENPKKDMLNDPVE